MRTLVVDDDRIGRSVLRHSWLPTRPVTDAVDELAALAGGSHRGDVGKRSHKVTIP